MNVKIIKTEDEYRDAVKNLEKLGDDPDFENNPELMKQFELIEKLIEDYDKTHEPIEKGNPIEIIKLKMGYMELKPKDLISAIGSKGLVSEVLNKKRKLSKKMIRNLSILLNISQEILNTEYEVSMTKCRDEVKETTALKTDIFHLPKTMLPYIENFSNSIFQRGAFFNMGQMLNR